MEIMPTPITKEIARQLREVYFGGNWTAVNLKETLANVTWQQATTRVNSFNTIAVLVYHMNYYVKAIIDVLSGDLLRAHDKYSFELPPVLSQQDWEKLLAQTRDNAEKAARLIEEMPEEKLPEIFFDKKYGNYYRNLHGLIEHTHYHLGQIVFLKKMLAESGKS
jgi:uncharacterized damage-inducible protein DinB